MTIWLFSDMGMQAKLVEEESNLSLKRWYLDTFGIALHQSSDPKMFHEALMSLQSCLQISDLEIQAVQLLDQIIRAGFDVSDPFHTEWYPIFKHDFSKT